MSRSKNKYNQRGASLLEYSILVALIAIVAIGGIMELGKKNEEKWKYINDGFDQASCGIGEIRNEAGQCVPEEPPCVGFCPE